MMFYVGNSASTTVMKHKWKVPCYDFAFARQARLYLCVFWMCFQDFLTSIYLVELISIDEVRGGPAITD